MKEQLAWMWSAADSPASLIPSPVSAEAPLTRAGSGRSSRASSARSVPPSSSSRTCLDCGRVACVMCWPTLPATGSMQSGIASLRPKSVRPTFDGGSSFWPTPTASTAGYNRGGGMGRVGPIRPSLRMMARTGMWPTPQAHDAQTPKTPEQIAAMRERSGAGVKNLNEEVMARMWPTPRATDGTHGGRVTPRKSREGGNLIEALSARTIWPTPMARDGEGRGIPSVECATRRIETRHSRTMEDAIALSDSPRTGQLNPTWVEWLMGFPLGHTACDFSAMPSSRRKRP